jgi:hypothetical protein
MEEVAERLSVKLEYDDLRKGEINTPGGAFVLRGERHILVHKHLTAEEKVDLLVMLLSKMDTMDIHLPPEVRERFDMELSHNQEAQVENG